ncbi:MAG: hypothetical protein RR846_01340 [Oscillospiraceae bacterium]
MNSRKIAFQTAMKYTVFGVFVFALYILQGTPDFLQIGGVKPIFLIGFCVNLAMLDESPYTIIIYILAGLLFELSASRIMGMITFPLIAMCVAQTIAVKFFFKANYRNTCGFSFLTMLVILSIDFVFNYLLHGYRGIGIVYVKTVLLTSAYSTVFSPIYYKIITAVDAKFRRFDAR